LRDNGENRLEKARDMAASITLMARGDVPAVTRLHAEVFERYDSTALGAAYLKALYRTVAEHSSCVSVVACEGNEVVGWIGGVLDHRSYNREIVLRCAARAPFIIASILKNRPRLLRPALTYGWNFIRGWIPGRRRHGSPAESPAAGPGTSGHPSPSALLLVIGVDVNRRGQGLARLMMADFHRRLSQEGFKSCTANVYADNEAGNRAFIKAGYRVLWSARGVNHYEKEIAA
jgi:ribosomal protein S18 acetylase RimI-like enzyme